MNNIELEKTPLELATETIDKLTFEVIASGWELTDEMQKRILKAARRSVARAHQAQVNRTKIGRNDKCPCGSGLKFKRCCGDWR